MSPRAISPLTIALEGISGVGKTSLARAVARKTGWPWVPEAWARLRPRPSLTFRSRKGLLDLERTLAREEFRRFRAARRLQARVGPVLLDTGLSGPLTYAAGLVSVLGGPDVRWELLGEFSRALALGAWGVPDLTVYLDAPPSVVATRARSDRGAHPFHLVDRHLRVGAFERSLFVDRLRSTAPSRILVLDARGSTETLATTLIDRLGRTRLPEVAAAADGLRFLSLVAENLGEPPGRSPPGNR